MTESTPSTIDGWPVVDGVAHVSAVWLRALRSRVEQLEQERDEFERKLYELESEQS